MIWIAADFSNWQRIPTDADIIALKNLGVHRVIVGTSFSRNNGDGTFTYIADQQMAVCEAAGFEVQEYQFIGHIYPTKRFWWLDIELLETQDEICDAIIAHHPDGIYTRRGIWQLLDWDIKAEFPWLELWDANYGPLPRTYIPYGGFSEPAMVQYHDTMDIGTGFAVDLSVYEEEVKGEEDMKPFLVWDLDRERVYLIGPFGAVWAPIQSDADALAVKYGGTTSPQNPFGCEMALHAATIDAFNT